MKCLHTITDINDNINNDNDDKTVDVENMVKSENTLRILLR